MEIPSFILPANGRATPEAVARKRRLAESLMSQGIDTSPVESPWQAVARVAQAGIGGYSDYQAGQQEEAGRSAANEEMVKLLSGNPDNAAIMSAMNNPWITDTQGRMASALMEENFRKARPPALTDDMQEYEYGQQDPAFIEYMQNMKRAGATNINMPGQPNIGSIPQGWQAIQDPETKAWTMAPIPGGPADAEAKKVAEAEQNRIAGAQQRGGIVTQEIDRALGVMQGGVLPDTGFGAYLSGVPGTDAKALSSLLDTVKANIGFEELNKMRQQSPTGGALGQVTERELAFLQAVAGSLDQAQSQEQLTDNLNRLWNAYQDVIHGPGQGPERRPLMFEQQQQQGGQPTSGAPAPGHIEDGHRFRGGNPADPNNWEPVQ